MPCLGLGAVLAVKVHSCTDINLEIAVVEKKTQHKKNPAGFQDIFASRHTVTL